MPRGAGLTCAFIALPMFATVALSQSKPRICEVGFENHLRLYEGCIASHAYDYEITGDSAESTAIAAINACDDYKKNFASYMDNCEGGPPGVGNLTMQKATKHFHDYAIRSVIQFRAARLTRKRP